MTIPEILKELEFHTGRFPMEAMKDAVAQREMITPELLRVLENAAADPVAFAKQERYMLHLFALFLLAEFREKRAYPLVVKMFSAPGETSFNLAGDTVTEGLSRILASVYDGDPAPLQRLIENADAYDYVRWSAIDALLILEESEQISRDAVAGYFHGLFHGKLERSFSVVWDGLVCATADLPAPELLKEVRQTYAEGLADPGVASLKSLERDLSTPKRRRRERLQLITDAIGEMKWWASFTKTSREEEESLSTSKPQAPLYTDGPPKPFVQEPKVGRNDPCPCGSGKKYKKCCGKG